jgi:hypothetical protein
MAYAIEITDAKRLVEGVEKCTLPKAEWTHEAHLIVGMYGVLNFGQEALPTMRKWITRYNLSVGGVNSETSGYHETLTVFWLWAIKEFCNDYGIHTFDVDAIDELLFYEPLARRSLVEDYYSEGILLTPEARRRFIRADKQPMARVEYFLKSKDCDC